MAKRSSRSEGSKILTPGVLLQRSREENKCVSKHQADGVRMPRPLFVKTMMNRCLLVTLFVALLASLSHAFVVKTPSVKSPTAMNALSPKLVKAATTAAVVISTSPLIALAEEDYEYGAVNAPIGLAWGVGVLAILTALLPIALRGGEEAFEDMKEKDADTWGTGNKDRLSKRK